MVVKKYNMEYKKIQIDYKTAKSNFSSYVQIREILRGLPATMYYRITPSRNLQS